jgi:hypothetical protein
MRKHCTPGSMLSYFDILLNINHINMNTSVKIIHWVPRILCIIAILFISMFALDSFSDKRTLWQNIAAFMIHLIPSFVLISLLIVTWRWELIGGIILTLIGFGLSPFVYIHNYKMNHSVGTSLAVIMMITFPFILTGILFIISHYMKKRNQSSS